MASSSNPAVSTTLPSSAAEKSEKFNGDNFKRWQKKMIFYLTTLGIASFLREDPSATPAENDTNNERCTAFDVWTQGDFLCRNYVLNGLVDSLYNAYADTKTTKALWDALEKKYKTDDARKSNNC